MLEEYRLNVKPACNISDRDGSVLLSDEICTSTPSLLSDCETAAIIGGIPFALASSGGAEEETNIEQHNIQHIVQGKQCVPRISYATCTDG